jgi:hypothetical protein
MRRMVASDSARVAMLLGRQAGLRSARAAIDAELAALRRELAAARAELHRIKSIDAFATAASPQQAARRLN